MRIRAIIPALAIALIGTAAYAKPSKGKHKGKEAAAADDAGEQGEEPDEDDAKAPLLPNVPGLTWQKGPTKGDLGNATIDVPAGFAFANTAGTRALMQAMQNEITNKERGTLWKIAPQADSWLVVFEYEDSGHIKDDDKDKLDADDLLKGITEGNEAANEDRRQKGWTALHVTGWQVPPHYDEQTHNLEWATKVVNEGKESDVSVNYNVRLLGRTGVMSAILLADPSQLPQATPEFKGLLSHYTYTEGSRYGDYKQGDKLAEYGIAALVAGGAVAVAAKSGLLGKLIKPLVAGIAAIGAAIGRLFKRGGKTPAATTPDATKKA
jgi:uncharacterized membrane-anchored protein